MVTDVKKRLLVISITDLARDPRVYRQIDFLHREYLVHAAGKGASGLEDEFFHLGQDSVVGRGSIWRPMKDCVYRYVRRVVLFIARVFGLPGLREAILLANPNYKRFISDATAAKYDLVLANDLSSLSLAAEVRGNAKLIYDAHEYSAGQNSEPRWFRYEKPYVDFILKKYLRSADAVTTVSEAIAEQYAKDFNIKKPVVITNATSFRPLSPQIKDEGLIRIVHHGIATRARAIETMIQTTELLDERFSLDLYLVPCDRQYYGELLSAGARCGRVRLLEPVAMIDLSARLNEYDIGLYILPPTSFNHLHALPNKLFEFVQARLTVAIGPSPEMARIVNDYGLGVVAADFSAEAMAFSISKLDYAAINMHKQNSNKYAKELSAEPQMRRLAGIVEALTSS